MAKQQEYKIHPAADCWPMLPEAEQRAQADSIAKIGLLVPVVLLDGMILDGRCRMKSCELAGIEPHFVEYDGDQTPEGIADYLDAVNDRRRHMTAIQIAATVVKLVNWQEKLADGRKRMGEGGKKKGGQGIQKVEYHSPADPNERTENSKLAERNGVNRQYIADCKRWQEERPEVVDQLRDGTLTYGQAKAIEKEAQQDADRRSQNRRVKVAQPAELKAMAYRLVIVGLEWIREFGANWLASMGDDKPLAEALDEDCLLFFRTGGDAEIGFRAGNIIDHWSCRRARRYFALLGTEKFNGETWENVIVGYRGKAPVEDIVPRSPVKCGKDGIEPALLAAAMPWLKECHSDKRVLHFAGKLVLPGAVNWPLKGEVVAA